MVTTRPAVAATRVAGPTRPRASSPAANGAATRRPMSCCARWRGATSRRSGRSTTSSRPGSSGSPGGSCATRPRPRRWPRRRWSRCGATRPAFDPAKGSATSWVLTITHRRAVDRVRSAQAGADRERRVAAASVDTPYDDVVEEVTASLEQQQVRRCLQGLTDLQREAITLAYYDGFTYREVAEKLDTALPTIKSTDARRADPDARLSRRRGRSDGTGR